MPLNAKKECNQRFDICPAAMNVIVTNDASTAGGQGTVAQKSVPMFACFH